MAKRYRVAVLGGDGIGPEVTREAVETIRLASEVHGFAVEWTDYPFGAEHYLKTKETLPPPALGHGSLEDRQVQLRALLLNPPESSIQRGMLTTVIREVRRGRGRRSTAAIEYAVKPHAPP